MSKIEKIDNDSVVINNLKCSLIFLISFQNKFKKHNEEYYFEAIKKKFSNTEFYTRKQRLSNKEFSFPKIWEFDFLRVHNCVIASSVLVEASLLKFLGGFRPIPSLNIKKLYPNIL